MLQHFDSTFAHLKGLTLTGVERESNSSIILRLGLAPSMALGVIGDCCSDSIFYAFDVPPLPCEIVGVEYLVEDGKTHTEEQAKAVVERDFIEFYFEELRVWDVVLKTTTGELRIRYINSSNGYYDGMVYLN